MAVQGVNGIAVAAVGAGLLFVWSGVKGVEVTHSLRSLLSGKQPSAVTTLPVGSTAFQGGAASSSAAGGGAVTPGHGSYSSGQLKSLWVLAGGDPARAGTAACIAMHESSGEAAVTSSNPDGGTNVGLWQLDTRGVGAGHTVAQLRNPLTNARVAVRGSNNGRDWSAWATAAMCGV